VLRRIGTGPGLMIGRQPERSWSRMCVVFVREHCLVPSEGFDPDRRLTKPLRR
jgi:hypothetical protein